MLGLRSIVVGDHHRIVVNPQVSIESGQQVLSQVTGVPCGQGRGQALAELMEDGLGHEGQGHLSVADVEVEGSGALPSQGLVEIEKFFDAPALGKVAGELADFVIVAGG